MTQPSDVFAETELDLEVQCSSLANPVCLGEGCKFVLSSVSRLVDVLHAAGVDDQRNITEVIPELSKNNPEVKRLAGNLRDSKEDCTGKHYGICAVGISE